MGNPTQDQAQATSAASKALTIAETGKQSVERYGDDRALRLEIRAMRRSLPGLATAEENDVLALIIAAKFSGLNPYAGEIYLIPGKGVMTASKVKAADAVTAAAKRGDFLVIDYDPVYKAMPLGQELGLEDGDVAYLCRIRSSKAEDRWYAQRRAIIDELKALGADRAEIQQELHERLPAPPDMRAVGIVKAGENFGDQNKKAVAFTRADRAKKRALIKCLNANGLAATDQRNYGGVQMAGDEPVEAQYTIRESTGARTPAEIKTDLDPEWAAAVDEATGDHQQPPPPPSPPATHEGAQRKLGRDEDSLLEGEPAHDQMRQPAQTAKDARERITHWAKLAHGVMATADVAIAAQISAAGSAAKAVLANRQATIGDLNRAADALMEFCRPKAADTPPGAPTTESLPF